MLTTHYLEEADALARRVVIIDHGTVIADDTANRLKSSLGDLITVSPTRPEDAPAIAERAAQLPEADVSRRGSVVAIRVPHGRERVPSLVRDLDAAGLDLGGIEVVGPTLDDVFLHLTGRSLRESGTSNTTEVAA